MQTKRHLFSNDLNILENFSRRLEDSLNIVNTLKTRFEQSQASEELLLHLRQLTRELHRLFSSIEGTLLDYSHEDDNIGRCFVSATTGHNGRPKIEVWKEVIEMLFEIHSSWQVVASVLRISVRTLRRRRTEFQMPVSNPIGPRIRYSEINEEDLLSNVREIIETLPDAGESYFIGSLRRRGIFIQRHRIRDPVGRALRKSVTVLRRVYSVLAPNSLWQVKLKIQHFDFLNKKGSLTFHISFISDIPKSQNVLHKCPTCLRNTSNSFLICFHLDSNFYEELILL